MSMWCPGSPYKNVLNSYPEYGIIENVKLKETFQKTNLESNLAIKAMET